MVLGIPMAVAACSSWACGSSDREERDPGEPADEATGMLGPAENAGQLERGAGPGALDESTQSSVNFGVSDEPTNEVEVVCAAQSAASELRHVSLAFLFDVSGSMGGNDQTRFETKWLPVVAASEGFFSEVDAAALSASLTFFPRADAATRCVAQAYAQPDVPETPLPSPLFAEAIAGLNYTLGSNTWRSSTPTLAAYEGMVASFANQPTDTLRVIVMVTDGVPQNCGAADDIQLVADAVRRSGIKTFVVGVANPPGDNAGDNLANLNVVAEAGGTGNAFIVATGDPAQTEADFKAVIDGIRGVSLACNIQIPIPPTGTAFVPEQVNVIYGSAGSAEARLNYDPDCTAPDAWRYDDPSNPATIQLCSESCGRAQREASARLTVEFGCERRSVPR
jgi:von Willebrand factor type A domain